jgi:hypothetical protein
MKKSTSTPNTEGRHALFKQPPVRKNDNKSSSGKTRPAKKTKYKKKSTK